MYVVFTGTCHITWPLFAPSVAWSRPNPWPEYTYFVCHDIDKDTVLLNQSLIQIVCQIHSVKCVSKIKSIPPVNFHTKYGAVCIQLTHLSNDGCENTGTLSYYQHQVRSMTNLPLFRVRSWNSGMRCLSFYILTETIWRLSYDNAIKKNYGNSALVSFIVLQLIPTHMHPWPRMYRNWRVFLNQIIVLKAIA